MIALNKSDFLQFYGDFHMQNQSDILTFKYSQWLDFLTSLFLIEHESGYMYDCNMCSFLWAYGNCAGPAQAALNAQPEQGIRS